MSKPTGPICNLDCTYCFYLEKEKLYPNTEHWMMRDDLLETYIRQYIESQPVDIIDFAWQGGEPTLLGVNYFEKVIALQQRYAN
ncbi:MAG: anaerobic sulfatase maturase, partial [Acidobacteriaceae bacterium]|nr:anaerobic sulfatase maturase [Acidobacteriaceae bacterium]